MAILTTKTIKLIHTATVTVRLSCGICYTSFRIVYHFLITFDSAAILIAIAYLVFIPWVLEMYVKKTVSSGEIIRPMIHML